MFQFIAGAAAGIWASMWYRDQLRAEKKDRPRVPAGHMHSAAKQLGERLPDPEIRTDLVSRLDRWAVRMLTNDRIVSVAPFDAATVRADFAARYVRVVVLETMREDGAGLCNMTTFSGIRAQVRRARAAMPIDAIDATTAAVIAALDADLKEMNEFDMFDGQWPPSP